MCNETKSSAFRGLLLETHNSSHKPRKAEDLVSLHVCVSSHIPRKAEDLVSLHVSVSSHIPCMCNETKSSAFRGL
jgi:hypothetical protein